MAQSRSWPLRPQGCPVPQLPLIAVVDDDVSLGSAIASLLRSAGYAACCHASAEQFIESGDLARCRCVLADIQMPGMSGLALSRQVVDSGAGVPVVLMTARTEAEFDGLAARHGAALLVRKPDFAAPLLAFLSAGIPPI